MNKSAQDNVKAISWQDDVLVLLDQRLLPTKVDYLRFDNVKDVAEAITNMVVRGAPAIGITAAYAVVIAARDRIANSSSTWKKEILNDIELLAGARPTAVNLFWALTRMKSLIESIHDNSIDALLEEAKKIHREDVEANHIMGELGSDLIDMPCSVLTHCNTGSLATGGFGTALGVIRQAYTMGKIKQVYADETRPWLQGARLTAWELAQDKIPVSLLVEGAAAHLLKIGDVRWVIVGADRIAANGDVANKIGTYGLAVLAKYHQVKFMVVAPTSTIDMAITTGDDIVIENRPESEILSFSGKKIAPDEIRAWNPAFDITPSNLVDVLITEKGATHQPNFEKLSSMMQGR